MMSCIGKSNSYVIQNQLAEQYKDQWEEHLPEMTYHKYITEHKLAAYKETKEFRAKSIEEIESFLPTLEKTNHRFFDHAKKRYDSCLEKLNNQIIVPSFYNLLRWLDNKNQEYKILIRTFGPDGDIVIKELKERINLDLIPARFGYTLSLMSDLPENNKDNAIFGKIYLSEDGNYIIRDQNNEVHSNYLKEININIDNLKKGLNDPKLKAIVINDAAKKGFVPKANAEGHFLLNISNGSKVELSTDDMSEIYKCWVDTDQHLAIRDNYDRWGLNNQHWKHGKPYPFERTAEQYISIFFDDNIKTDNSEKNIVAPYDIATGQFVDVRTAFEEGYLHLIEPLKAIEDDNYFISLVEASLEKVFSRKDSNHATNEDPFVHSRTFTPMHTTQISQVVIEVSQEHESLAEKVQRNTVTL